MGVRTRVAFASSTNFYTSRLTDLDANHIHAWELTETSGATFADTGSSAQKVNLTIANTANVRLATAGILGYCPFFSATATGTYASAQAGALVSAFNDLPLTNWTIEMWASPSFIGTSAVNMLFSCDFTAGANVQFSINGSTSATLAAVLRATAFVTPTSTAQLFFSPSIVNAWNYYAMTYDGASLLLYVNGELIRNQAVAGNTQWTNTTGTPPQLTIANQLNGGAPFSGRMSRVRMSNIARTQAYLRSVYQKGMLYAAA